MSLNAPIVPSTVEVRQVKGHILPLTGIRGLAAWWIVLYHFKHFLEPFLPRALFLVIGNGHLAVDLFFCLSGFVLYVNYKDLAFSRSSISLYYLKRLSRIYPLHALILLAYTGLVGVVLIYSSVHRVQENRYSLWLLLINLALMQDWGIGSNLSWNIPAWSISAECAAYLLFPVLLKALKLPRASSLMLAIYALSALGSLAVVFSMMHSDLGGYILQLGVFRCLTQFTVGLVIGEVYVRRNSIPPLVAWALILSGVGLVSLVVGYGLDSALLIPPAWASLIAAVALGNGVLTDILSLQPLVFMGEISYATYMCHYLVYDVFKLVFVNSDLTSPLPPILGAFAFVGLLSTFLYQYVERPCQAWLIKNVPGSMKCPQLEPEHC